MKPIVLKLGRLATLLVSLALYGGEPTLEIYSDFQCPYCGQLAAPVEQLRKVAGDRVRVVFRHFPLSFHADAALAHRAAAAAAEQGKFWEMHDLLFANQGALKKDNLLAYAGRIGLELNRFARDLEDPRLEAIVERDRAAGTLLGVSGTPTMFLNGKRVSGGRSFRELRRIFATETGLKLGPELPAAALEKGAAGSNATIEAFLDLGSPLSYAALDVIDELLGSGEPCRVRFRHLPATALNMPLHSAVSAAAAQGQLWPMINALPASAAVADKHAPARWALAAGLDAVRFRADLAGGAYDGLIEEDLQEARRLGIRGAPAFVVNGRRIDGVPTLVELRAAVRRTAESGPRSPAQ